MWLAVCLSVHYPLLVLVLLLLLLLLQLLLLQLLLLQLQLLHHPSASRKPTLPGHDNERTLFGRRMCSADGLCEVSCQIQYRVASLR